MINDCNLLLQKELWNQVFNKAHPEALTIIKSLVTTDEPLGCGGTITRFALGVISPPRPELGRRGV